MRHSNAIYLADTVEKWLFLMLKSILIKYGGARGVVVIVDTATRVQILDLTDCISHSTNTLWKGMNPSVLPPAMGK